MAQILKNLQKIDFEIPTFISYFKILDIRIIIYIKLVPGDYCKGVTPDPIPNSAVKPFSANGTLS